MSETSKPAVGASPLTVAGGLLMMVATLLTVAYVIWPHEVLSMGLLWRHWELQVIGLFTDRYSALDAAIVNPNWNHVGIVIVAQLGSVVGRAYNIPGALFLLALAGVCLLWTPGKRYRDKIETLDDLIMAMHPRFGAQRAFVGRKRRLRSPEKGKLPRPGDVALHPHEWLATYARDAHGTYLEDLARQALERQLGSVWTGPHAAADHVRCLFAAFALHASRDRDSAIDFLAKLAQSVPPGNGEAALALPAEIVREADQIVENGDLIESCVAVAQRHYYTTTAMIGVLLHARDRAGVLAPNQFNWLKLVDRELWYALLTKPNPDIEAAGAHAHHAAERAAEAPLPVPHVEPALKAARAHRE